MYYNKELEQEFIDNFNEFSAKHIFEHDFYNLSDNDRFDIAKETFFDIAEFLDYDFGDLAQDLPYSDKICFYDNVVANFMEMLV